MLSSLVTSSRVFETIDECLMRCGISRRDFVKFCSSLILVPGMLSGGDCVPMQYPPLWEI